MTEITWPGQEIGDDHLRSVAQRLVREQGWSYLFRGKHPKLIPPVKERPAVTFPSTASDWRSRLNALSDLRRSGADLTFDSARKTVRGVGQSADMTLTFTDLPHVWTEREWRERQRDEVWWRAEQYAPPLPEPEPEPEPEKPQVRAYHAEFMDRLDRSKRVKDDAQGNGRWTLAAARQQLKDGYALEAVIERTGWGRMWLADLADRLAAG